MFEIIEIYGSSYCTCKILSMEVFSGNLTASQMADSNSFAVKSVEILSQILVVVETSWQYFGPRNIKYL